MATEKSPSYEGLKQFGRTLLVGTVSTVLVSLIAIFSLGQAEFLVAIQNPLTWYAFGQTVGLFLLKDVLSAIGMGVDKGVHIEGKNTDNETLEKGITGF